MSSSNNPSPSADQDDPWEELADQFGIETGKEYVAREPAPPQAAPATPPAAPQAIDSASAANASIEKHDSGAGAARGEPPRFASEAVAEVNAPRVEPCGAEIPGDADEAAHKEPVSAQDSYWDALANWNWDESEGGAGKARSEQRPPEPRRSEQPPPRQQHGSDQPPTDRPSSEKRRSDERRSGGRPPRGGRDRDDRRERRGGERRDRRDRPPAAQPPSAAAPSPATARVPREAAAPDSDDFGSGVEDDARGFSAPTETTDSEGSANYGAAEDVPPIADAESDSSPGTAPDGGHTGHQQDRVAEGEGSFPRRRRRRRRRRGGRGGESAAATSPVPLSDWDDSAGPETELSDAASISEEGPFDDDEGNEPEELDIADGTISESEPGTEETDGDDELGDEQTVSYENIPTWEEAISYLLHPNQVQVESGTTGGGPKPPRGSQPTDQPRQTRHIGHRKHRR